MEETILAWLEASWPVAKDILMYVGGAVVLLRTVVKLTPSGKDDAIVAKLDAIPLVGGLLAGVASRAPIQEKK